MSELDERVFSEVFSLIFEDSVNVQNTFIDTRPSGQVEFGELERISETSMEHVNTTKNLSRLSQLTRE